MKIQLTAVLSAALFAGLAHADARFDAVADKSSVKVEGDSSLHAWTVKTSNISGYIDVKGDLAADASATQVREAIIKNPDIGIEVEISVDTIKSDKADMDKKMHAAFKQPENPKITYKLTKLEIPADAKADQEELKVKTTGNLTIAGTTKETQIPMTLKMSDAKTLQLSGSTDLKMTDFGMKPPEAMAGLIKADDQVKVQFEWNTARAADSAKK